MKSKYLQSVYFLFYLLAVVIFSSCDDDEKERTAILSVNYYTFSPAYSQPIISNDIVKSEVSRHFFLSVESSSDNIDVDVSDIAAVDIQNNSDNAYYITSKKAGTITITVKDKSSGKSIPFNLVIEPYPVKFSSIDIPGRPGFTTIYKVNTPDELLKQNILNELKQNYIMAGGILYYDSYSSGKFEITMKNNKVLWDGVFTVRNKYDFTAFYSGKQYFPKWKLQESPSSLYYIIQDFTNDFREKYSFSIIDKVELSTPASISSGQLLEQ